MPLPSDPSSSKKLLAGIREPQEEPRPRKHFIVAALQQVLFFCGFIPVCEQRGESFAWRCNSAPEGT
jgi:hypothetical protein